MSARPTFAGSTLTAAEWNAQYPVGWRVVAEPGPKAAEGGAAILTRTRSTAWELGDGTPVVAVKGYPGGIGLTHVTPVHPPYDELLTLDEVEVRTT